MLPLSTIILHNLFLMEQRLLNKLLCCPLSLNDSKILCNTKFTLSSDSSSANSTLVYLSFSIACPTFPSSYFISSLTTTTLLVGQTFYQWPLPLQRYHVSIVDLRYGLFYLWISDLPWWILLGLLVPLFLRLDSLVVALFSFFPTDSKLF